MTIGPTGERRRPARAVGAAAIALIRSVRRAVRITWCPAVASLPAVAAPMPLLAPVTVATIPFGDWGTVVGVTVIRGSPTTVSVTSLATFEYNPKTISHRPACATPPSWRRGFHGNRVSFWIEASCDAMAGSHV